MCTGVYTGIQVYSIQCTVCGCGWVRVCSVPLEEALSMREEERDEALGVVGKRREKENMWREEHAGWRSMRREECGRNGGGRGGEEERNAEGRGGLCSEGSG